MNITVDSTCTFQITDFKFDLLSFILSMRPEILTKHGTYHFNMLNIRNYRVKQNTGNNYLSTINGISGLFWSISDYVNTGKIKEYLE